MPTLGLNKIKKAFMYVQAQIYVQLWSKHYKKFHRVH